MASILRRGKAVSDPHYQRSEGPGMIPVISIDFAFMGSGQYEDEGNQNPLVIMEDDTTKLPELDRDSMCGRGDTGAIDALGHLGDREEGCVERQSAHLNRATRLCQCG